MGAKESKITFLPYEDAVKKVSEKELEQVRKAFKRHAGNANFISKTVFFNEVLGELVPARLAEQLFITCGGNSKGISFRDIFVILVLITNGSRDEKLKFLFYFMSVDGTSVTKEDLENFFTACDGGVALPQGVAESFSKAGEKCNFDEFCQWMKSHSEFSAVTRWLLEEQFSKDCIKISSVIDTPSFHHSLARLTNLSDADIIELEKRYYSLKSYSKTGRFDLETFRMHITPPLPEQFCSSFFCFFDKNSDDHIDLRELVCGIALCCRGLTKDRLYACFQMFDTDNDDWLSENELSVMVDGLLEICQQYEDVKLTKNDTESIKVKLKQLTQNSLLSFDEFRQWASTSILIHEYLLLLSQICHIIFGLKPAFQEEEGLVTRRWLDRENKCGLKPGKLYYLISMHWWQQWKEYVHFEGNVQNNHDEEVVTKNGGIKNTTLANTEKKENKKRILNGNSIIPGAVPPGNIDNNCLLGVQDTRKLMVLTGEGGKLKTNVVLMHKKDYEVLPEPIWSALLAWYGGNVALPRTVIQDMENVEPVIELFPIQLFIYKHTIPPKSNGFNLSSIGINNFITQIFGASSSSNGTQNNSPEQPVVVAPKRTLTYRASFSRKNTVKQIIDFIGQRLKINPDDLRLWTMLTEAELNLIEEEDKAVESLLLKDGSSLLLEVRNRDLSWPEEMNTLVATHNFRERSHTGLLEKGATGLHNLGNTCFMNSAVQCLSNTKPLTQYFCSKVFTYELNKTNPLGMKGILAKRYGDLVLDLWSGIYRSIAPVKLRWTIGRYAPRFNGFQQHDSQELLSFLLDGLHEDLNRVHNKPYVELKDSDGRPDNEVADEAWENHIKRNKSIIVDLFQGQLKSQVRCMHCNHISVRFDPFIFLSLPLPMESSLHIEIPVFCEDGKKVHRYGLLLANDASILMVKKALSELCKIPTECLLLAEVVGASVKNFISDNQKLRASLIGYIFAYEVDSKLNIQCTNVIPKDNTFASNETTTKNSDNDKKKSTISNLTNSCDDKKKTTLTNLTNSNDKLDTLEHSNSSDSLVLSPSKKAKTKLKTKINIFSHSKTHPIKILEVAPKETVEIKGVANMSVSPNHSSVDDSTSVAECKPDNTAGLIVIMSRKMNESSAYFLSWQKYHPMLFGVPLIMSCLPNTSNENIYSYVWKHVSKFLTCPCSDMESNKKYPFVIKTVEKEGNYCVWCPWYRFCRGCPVPCNGDYFRYASSHLTIDWDPVVLHLQYQYSLEKSYIDDESIERSYQRLRDPICLDQCLRDFTKEEELGADETWYCSKCEEHRTIAKKFDIWKLPPILVIHLKRFQLVNSRWVKSNKMVRFPTQSFDPSVYMSKSETTKSNENSHKHRLENVNSIEEISMEDFVNKNEVPEQISCSKDEDCLYDLYAISCHSGMLSGGHYITFTKNPNGKWYCYNDSTCKDIDPSIINKEAPYMLFYERKHINTIDYLPNIKGKQPLNVQQEEDEFDKEVKKYCSIM